MPRRRPARSNTPSAANARSEAATVRLIAGQWRGRVLRCPAVDGLRPTGNRVRETLFNWLMPVIEGASVLDAFSGSGALGFEALSRGAKRAVMLEPELAAHKQLVANAELLEAANAKIFGTRAEQWLAIDATEAFDVVFIDPPFARDLWSQVIDQLESRGWLNSDALIYIETPKNYALQLPANWRLHRQKAAGNVSYALYQREAV